MTARVTQYKEEADSDIHLVLKDSANRSMIAEIPAPSCVGSSSRWKADIATARHDLDAHLPAVNVVASHQPRRDIARAWILRPASRSDRRRAQRNRAPSRHPRATALTRFGADRSLPETFALGIPVDREPVPIARSGAIFRLLMPALSTAPTASGSRSFGPPTLHRLRSTTAEKWLGRFASSTRGRE